MSFSKNTASYSVSQNFMTAGQTIGRLVRLAKLAPFDDVIEIGAGKGHITRALCRTCQKVTAYEIDPALCHKLSEKMAGTPGLTLYNRDFLQAKLPAQGEYKVFANIPFSITSAILRKLSSAPNPPKEAWLVMEKGAAKRFLGQPHEAAASLLLKPFFELKVVYHFRRTDFHPAPSVDTVFVRLSRRVVPDLPLTLQAAYTRFVEGVLRHGPAPYLTKKQTSMALRLAGLPPLPPSGHMLYVQWLCLFRCYIKMG